jgi:hypothetical protein
VCFFIHALHWTPKAVSTNSIHLTNLVYTDSCLYKHNLLFTLALQCTPNNLSTNTVYYAPKHFIEHVTLSLQTYYTNHPTTLVYTQYYFYKYIMLFTLKLQCTPNTFSTKAIYYYPYQFNDYPTLCLKTQCLTYRNTSVYTQRCLTNTVCYSLISIT